MARTIRILPISLVVLVASLMSVAATKAPTASLHLRLLNSAPAADSTVTRLVAVQLWFSESPQAGATSIAMVDPRGEPVELDDVEVVDGDDTVLRSALATAPLPGTYQVVWRTLAADGHVVQGDYHFTLRAQ